MSFGFRKGFTSGPFRMTFSKSGVSMSVGAGGARLTAGPRGTRVSYSKGGFYYRTRIDSPPKGPLGPQAPPPQRESIDAALPVSMPPAETTPSITTTPEIFGDTTPDAVVEAMNRRIKRRNYAIPAGIVVSGGLLAAAVPWPIVAVVGVVATVLVAMQHSRSKYTSLVYGDEKETSERLEALHKAVAALRSADSVWSVREANHANGLTAHPATLSRTKIGGEPPALPKYLRTNITPAALQLADGTLYFFPDRLFVWHSGRFAAIDYTDVKLRFSRVTFLEREKQPPDSVVESQVRRSSSVENAIPVLYYGLAEVSSSGLEARLMTSRVESAEEFASQMRTITGGVEPTVTADEKEPLYTHFDARVPLFYNLNEDGFRQLQTIREAFTIIQRCDCVWCYEGEERTDDWKRNAGAGTLVTRSRLYPALVDQSPGFESNVAFGFSLGHSTLFLLPDGFVLGTGERYQALGKSLDVNASTTNFREEEFSPRDAELIGKTWRYVNKSGGPDRRFNDNGQIPINRYGQLEIGCGAWKIRLCLSRANAAAEFATALRSAMSGHAPDAHKERSEAPPPKPASQPAGLVAAFSLLGLRPGASFEDASAAYKSLAAQNHPDKVAHMAPEFRELAERKMRELNAAYEQIQTLYQKRP